MPTHSPEESKRYREKHKEDLKLRKKLDYEKNKAAYKARARKSEKQLMQDPEYKKKRFAQIAKNHDTPEYKAWKKQYMKEYRAANRGKFTEYERRRNAAKVGCEVVQIDYEALYQASPQCFYCGKPLKREEVHFDHYVPLSKGGSHSESNIRIACPFCNMSKKDKMPEDFLATKDKGLSDSGGHPG